MALEHGISALTQERILLGPGALYLDSTVIGASKGGNSFEITRTFRDIRPDGAKGKVKGFRILESVEAVLTCRLLEFDEDIFLNAFPGGSLTTNVITGGELAIGDYIDEVSIIADITGVTSTTEANKVEVAITDCIMEGPVSVNLAEFGETVIELKFTAHYDPAALTTEPWSITFTPVT